MIVAFGLIGLGIFLLIEVRNGHFNETLLSISFLLLGLFIFIGHWLPFNGGRFLYGVILLFMLANEMVRFFERVVLMLKSASINSMTDPLTGLYNKGFLHRKSAQLIEKQEIGIIFADIDNFKQLNDTKGHDVGDTVLQQVASLLEEIIGDSGFAVRFGGEELVGIVQNGDTEELAGRFCRQVAKKTQVTVSVGTAVGKDDSKGLIKLADERMYSAKASGKNKVVS